MPALRISSPALPPMPGESPALGWRRYHPLLFQVLASELRVSAGRRAISISGPRLVLIDPFRLPRVQVKSHVLDLPCAA